MCSWDVLHEMGPHVAIVGAGIAGLQAAHLFKQAGCRVTLYERASTVGGVWRQNYAGYRLQGQRWHYDIPGYPWPAGTFYPYPTGAQVQAYIESYARDADLLPHITFGAKVTQLVPLGDNGDNGWLLQYHLTGDASHTPKQQKFDYVVVATGLFNRPHRPSWADKEHLQHSGYTGQVVDAVDFTDASAAKNKHVVLVGCGKTAIDVALAVSSQAASTTLLARRGHWWAPQKVLGIIPFEFAAFTRCFWALQPAWYSASAANKGLHTLFHPLVSAAWKLFEVLFPLHTGTPKGLVPQLGLLEGTYDTIGIVDAPVVRRAFNSGAVKGVQGEVQATLPGHSVKLASGDVLQADLIILATGYQNNEQQLLPEKLQRLAGYDGLGNQWLYRNVLPLGLHNIVFLGLNGTFQHVLTTALQSRWLVEVLTGQLALPPVEEREADVAAYKAWLTRGFNWRRTNNFVWAQHGKYHDTLVRDLGHDPWRKGNLLSNLFSYIKSEDYAFLFPGNKAIAAGQAHQAAGSPAPNDAISPHSTSRVISGGSSGVEVAVRFVEATSSPSPDSSHNKLSPDSKCHAGRPGRADVAR